jgi:hypothetical protein
MERKAYDVQRKVLLRHGVIGLLGTTRWDAALLFLGFRIDPYRKCESRCSLQGRAREEACVSTRN